MDGKKMKCFLVNTRRNDGAIRLRDVAVIVCVAVVLAALLLLRVGHFKEHALRTQCQGNFRQIGIALAVYAKDNKDLLPDCSADNPRFTGPLWPWDVNTNLLGDLQTLGATRQVLYCPANPGMNDSRHWNFWQQTHGSVSCIGYGMLFKGMGQVPRNLWRENLAGNGQTPPAETELSFDATACVDDDYEKIQGVWVDRSNHMRDKTPLGGNVLFEDQHVGWRDFADTEERFRTIGPGGQVHWSF
jgi:hypothetical protein